MEVSQEQGLINAPPHVLIIISALPFVVIYALLNASPEAKRSGGGVGSCLNSSSMPVID